MLGRSRAKKVDEIIASKDKEIQICNNQLQSYKTASDADCKKISALRTEVYSLQGRVAVLRHAMESGKIPRVLDVTLEQDRQSVILPNGTL